MWHSITERTSLAAIFLAAFCFVAPAVSITDAEASGNREVADPEAAALLVRNVSRDVLSVLNDPELDKQARTTQLRDLLEDNFNMKYIALLTLGPYRRHIGADDMAAYERVFADFMLTKYATLLNGYSGEALVIAGARRVGKRDAIVRSQIESATGEPIEAEWRVRVFNGQARIIDLKIEGLSLAQSQRQEFISVIDRSGFDGLIDILRTDTESPDRA